MLLDSVHLYCGCSNKLTWITHKELFSEFCSSAADVNVDFGQETTLNNVVFVAAIESLADSEA